LKPNDIEALEFSVPASTAMDKFHKFADSIWKKIEVNYNQIRTLTALRDTLLPKLMSGEVRVKMDTMAKMEDA
jgi:type I restriction enzyme S subunit